MYFIVTLVNYTPCIFDGIWSKCYGKIYEQSGWYQTNDESIRVVEEYLQWLENYILYKWETGTWTGDLKAFVI